MNYRFVLFRMLLDDKILRGFKSKGNISNDKGKIASFQPVLLSMLCKQSTASSRSATHEWLTQDAWCSSPRRLLYSDHGGVSCSKSMKHQTAVLRPTFHYLQHRHGEQKDIDLLPCKEITERYREKTYAILGPGFTSTKHKILIEMN